MSEKWSSKQQTILNVYVSLNIFCRVDTVICEQAISWLSRYSRIMHHMNKEHFPFCDNLLI